MPDPESTDDFTRSLTESQGRLYGYVYSLINDHDAAADILQECNLVLWKKIDEFREGADFIPWAFGIARFQVLAYLRDKRRRQVKLLDPAVADLLHPEVEEQAAGLSEMQAALQYCLKRLPRKNRDLLRRRYTHATPIKELAESMGRTPSAIKVQLFRVRAALRKCIEENFPRGGSEPHPS